MSVLVFKDRPSDRGVNPSVNAQIDFFLNVLGLILIDFYFWLCPYSLQDDSLSNADLVALAQRTESPILWVSMMYDSAIVIDGVHVMTGMTEEQAAFVFATCFSTFLIEWTTCKNLGISKTLEVVHRYVFYSIRRRSCTRIRDNFHDLPPCAEFIFLVVVPEEKRFQSSKHSCTDRDAWHRPTIHALMV